VPDLLRGGELPDTCSTGTSRFKQSALVLIEVDAVAIKETLL